MQEEVSIVPLQQPGCRHEIDQLRAGTMQEDAVEGNGDWPLTHQGPTQPGVLSAILTYV